MMSTDIGPSMEQTALPADQTEQFHTVTGALAEGALCFPAPFDLRASAALRRNTLAGDDAEILFDAARVGTDRRYRVTITEELLDDPETREVIDCVVLERATLAAMLLGFAHELTMPEDPDDDPDNE